MCFGDAQPVKLQIRKLRHKKVSNVAVRGSVDCHFEVS